MRTIKQFPHTKDKEKPAAVIPDLYNRATVCFGNSNLDPQAYLGSHRVKADEGSTVKQSFWLHSIKDH
jgi:hypothetical protein